MKNILLSILFLTLISCNELNKEVESAFSAIGIQLDSLNKIEEKKIEKHFKEINSKRINKNDGENSALIYHSAIKHNRIVDSLIVNLKLMGETDIEKKKIIDQFEYEKNDLRNKLNTVTTFNTKAQINSLLKPNNDIEMLSNFAIIPAFQSGKLNSSISAELLLKNLDDKTKNEKKLNKD